MKREMYKVMDINIYNIHDYPEARCALKLRVGEWSQPTTLDLNLEVKSVTNSFLREGISNKFLPSRDMPEALLTIKGNPIGPANSKILYYKQKASYYFFFCCTIKGVWLWIIW